MGVTKMRTLRWKSEHTRKGKVWNECTQEKVGVALIEEKMTKTRLQ